MMRPMQKLSIALAAIAALGAVFAVTSASAFPVYEYSGTHFGGYGTGTGEIESAAPAAATDSSGNFWVVDEEHGVDKFNSKGEFVLSVTEGKYELGSLSDVAVDSAGDVWVSDRSGERVVEFSPTGAYIREFGEFGSGNGQFWHPEHIAIDPSGHLWVSDGGNTRVQEFTSEGAFMRKFGSYGTGLGQFTSIAGLAADAEGNIWAVDGRSGSSRIEEFNSWGVYQREIGSAVLGEVNGLDHLAFSAGNLWFSDTGCSCIKVLDVSGELLGQFGGVEESEGELLGPSSVVFDPGGDPWILNYGKGILEKWVPKAPSTFSLSAINISASEATLRGSVNPEGSSTTYQFEYGTTASYGSKVPASPASAGSAVGYHDVSQVISGLAPDTTYHYRVVATSAAGTTYSSDKTFRTAITSEVLEELAVINPFDGSSGSLADFSSNWGTMVWAAEQGEDVSNGWRSVLAFPSVAGSYYIYPSTDSGDGIATIAYLSHGPGVSERYFSLWLDMSSPLSFKSGYELRCTEEPTSPSTFNVTLAKWKANTQTQLASQAGYTVATGSSLALVDEGSKVSAWFKEPGSAFTKVLSASDSTFSSGVSALEASGNSTRLQKVQAGAL